MANKDDISPLLHEIKTDARHLQEQAKERGEDLIYGHALDQASKKLFNVDWNTACAMAKNGTLSLDDKPIQRNPLVETHYAGIHEGIYFPHQFISMTREMEIDTLDGKGKTIIIPESVRPQNRHEYLSFLSAKPAVAIIGTADVTDDEISKVVELANSGDLEFDVFDFTDNNNSMNRDENHADMDAIEANIGVRIQMNVSDQEEPAGSETRIRQHQILHGVQSIEDFHSTKKKGNAFVIPDFHPPKPQKIFYTKRNYLMNEHEAIFNDPDYEEIPYDLTTFEEMNEWVKKQGGGALFFPTNSIAGLKAQSGGEQTAVENNTNTKNILRSEKSGIRSISGDQKNSFFKKLNANHSTKKMKKGR